MTMAVPTTTVVVEALRTLLPVEAPLLRRPTLVVARSRDRLFWKDLIVSWTYCMDMGNEIVFWLHRVPLILSKFFFRF